MANTRKDKLLCPTSGSYLVIKSKDKEVARFPKPSYRSMRALLTYFTKGYEKVDESDSMANTDFYLELLQILCNSQDKEFMGKVMENLEIPEDSREEFTNRIWRDAMDKGISFTDFHHAIIEDISKFISGLSPFENEDKRINDVENPPAIVGNP